MSVTGAYVKNPMLVHIDGDAFFASVYQALNAHARGKPVAIGRERAIITALSYEAKARGVRRGMLATEAKRICPELLVVSSDYRAYQVFSNTMVKLAETYSPRVERYSIDEVFIDVTGLDTVHKLTYTQIATKLKAKIEKSLGLTVSVGVATTKTLAKIASNAEKPSGLVTLDESNRQSHLHNTDIGDIWGIGHRLAARMRALRIHTAFDLTEQSEVFLRHHFNKPVLQTWHELHGHPMFGLTCGQKLEYQSIQKTATVTPATNDRRLLLSRVAHHIEKAFIKARRHGYRVSKIDIFLKTNKFSYRSTNIKLPHPVSYPYLIRTEIRTAFAKIYRSSELYRSTGCTLYDFEDPNSMQQDLFEQNQALEEKLSKLYTLYEDRKIRFGTDLFETQKHERPALFRTLKLSG